MRAVFMADPTDPRYQDTLLDVLEHVRTKDEQPVRLHIQTRNELWKSTDPKRTFQVMSLDSIDSREIVHVEEVIPE
jgi:hypothetical protein